MGLKEKYQNLLDQKGLTLNIVDYGIAWRIKDRIYVNENLFKYPEYCAEVMDHELRHSGSYTLNDLKMDLVEGSFRKNMLFCARHPKSLKQFLPIGFNKGTMFIDVNLILVYSIIGLMGGLFFWLI